MNIQNPKKIQGFNIQPPTPNIQRRSKVQAQIRRSNQPEEVARTFACVALTDGAWDLGFFWRLDVGGWRFVVVGVPGHTSPFARSCARDGRTAQRFFDAGALL